jgi:hypothetical protein
MVLLLVCFAFLQEQLLGIKSLTNQKTKYEKELRLLEHKKDRLQKAAQQTANANSEVCLRERERERVCVYVCVYVRVCVYSCVRVVCVRVGVYAPVCMYVCIRVCVCTCECMYIYVCINLYYVSECVCTCVYIYMCVCAYVCMHAY